MRNKRAETKIVDGRRRCKHEECDTILSMYNSDEYCASHLRDILSNSTSLNQWLP